MFQILNPHVHKHYRHQQQQQQHHTSSASAIQAFIHTIMYTKGQTFVAVKMEQSESSHASRPTHPVSRGRSEHFEIQIVKSNTYSAYPLLK